MELSEWKADASRPQSKLSSHWNQHRMRRLTRRASTRTSAMKEKLNEWHWKCCGTWCFLCFRLYQQSLLSSDPCPCAYWQNLGDTGITHHRQRLNIRDCLGKRNPHKSMGLDGMHLRLLRLLAHVLEKLLSSLKSHVFQRRFLMVGKRSILLILKKKGEV